MGQPSSMSLSLSWVVPDNRGSGVVGYRVEVQRLRHRSQASKDLLSEPLTPEFDKEIKETQVQVTQGLGMCLLN